MNGQNNGEYCRAAVRCVMRMQAKAFDAKLLFQDSENHVIASALTSIICSGQFIHSLSSKRSRSRNVKVVTNLEIMEEDGTFCHTFTISSNPDNSNSCNPSREGTNIKENKGSKDEGTRDAVSRGPQEPLGSTLVSRKDATTDNEIVSMEPMEVPTSSDEMGSKNYSSYKSLPKGVERFRQSVEERETYTPRDVCVSTSLSYTVPERIASVVFWYLIDGCGFSSHCFPNDRIDYTSILLKCLIYFVRRVYDEELKRRGIKDQMRYISLLPDETGDKRVEFTKMERGYTRGERKISRNGNIKISENDMNSIQKPSKTKKSVLFAIFCIMVHEQNKIHISDMRESEYTSNDPRT